MFVYVYIYMFVLTSICIQTYIYILIILGGHLINQKNEISNGVYFLLEEPDNPRWSVIMILKTVFSCNCHFFIICLLTLMTSYADYCWSIKRDSPETDHSRQSRKRKFIPKLSSSFLR